MVVQKKIALTIWLTGLSGAGKSTLAQQFEKNLLERKIACCILDGDHLRLGLNKDLGFSANDRAENVRRVAEVSRLMNDAGLVVIVPVIAPFEVDRQIAQSIIGEENFRLVYIKTPLEVCEQRDPKGMYKKARALAIQNFTGISSPYEPPQNAHLEINTSNLPILDCVLLLETLIQAMLDEQCTDGE